MAPQKPKIKRRIPTITIVGDGGIAIETIGDGRMIPLVILESSKIPAIDEMINLHQYVASGDVVTDWGRLAKDAKSIVLLIKARRPIEVEFAILFEVPKHLGLVDQILTSNGLYMQTGKHGDRISNTPGRPRILVEIPSGGRFSAAWEKNFPSLIAKQLRQEGHSRRSALIIAEELVSEWRQIGNLRMKSRE